ncbi:prephenate dehydrogenase/arogenate dehydrogenase family protein [Patescibacteria group bacterium]|nr:prephenate dehydrogenase/arogenate dehydrogenase family protein [Patescibacteria group bacterium]
MQAPSNLTVGIIGYGDFGSFLHRFIRTHLPQVSVVAYVRGREPDRDVFFPFEEVCASDIVIPAVPIRAFADTLERIAPHVRPQTVIADVATVKTYTVDLLKKYEGKFRFIATHPMFGPYSYEKKGKSLAGLRLVVCERTIDDGSYAKVKRFFEELGLDVIEMTAEEHDREIAGTLFLTHLIGQVVTQGNFRRTDIDTVSFGFLMDAVESVQNDTALFEDVYRYNPYCKDALARLDRAEADVRTRLTKEDAVG